MHGFAVHVLVLGGFEMSILFLVILDSFLYFLCEVGLVCNYIDWLLIVNIMSAQIEASISAVMVW